jgi:hypothetical protein
MKKKRHHYIPEFYLKGFINLKTNFLWMYQKGNDQVKIVSPRNAAVITYYYSFKNDKEDIDTNTIEDMMSMVEGEASPIFSKIDNEKMLNDDDRKILSLFISFLRIRVPNFRQNIEASGSEVVKITMKRIASNEKYFNSLLEMYKKETGKSIDIPLHELRDFALDDSRYKVEMDPIFSLSVGLNMVIELSEIIYKMRWNFLIAKDEYEFITSDNPIVIFDPSDISGSPIGLLLKDTLLCFPINRKLSLLADWESNSVSDYINIKNAGVKDINRRVVINARKYVFSPEKKIGIQRLVKKYSEYYPKIEVVDSPPYIITINKPF